MIEQFDSVIDQILYDRRSTDLMSDCCGAEVVHTDICNECLEHCEPIPVELEDFDPLVQDTREFKNVYYN